MNALLDIVPEAEEGNDDENLSTGSDQQLLQESPIFPPIQSNKLRINVGGIRHETYKSTLKNIPDTRLAWLASASTNNNADYDPVAKEFYFDRHPGIFNAILNYYRTGRLHAPSDVCGPAFEDELQFWGIDEKQIEPCCWSNYTQHRDAQETLAKLQGDNVELSDNEGGDDVAKIFGIEEEAQESKTGWYTKWRPRIWIMLEEPYSSRAAKILAITSLAFVMISITAFCMETAEPFQEVHYNNETGEVYTEPVVFLFAIEGVCVAFFTLELIVRFIFCPNKCRFFLTLETVIDIVACIPFYVDAVRKLSNNDDHQGSDFLSFLRIVRVFRIFKLARHLSGLQVLVHTLKASAKELLLLIIFMGLGVLISSSLVYYAERWAAQPGDRNDFDNIPVGFWWAVVTMTTVGYGDRVPRTWMGMIVGAVTAIIGVLTLALPVPVIVNNFALYYTHAQARQKLPKKRKRVLVGAADALKTQSVQFLSSSISGYSTQSTNEGEGDTNSIRSDDAGIRTAYGFNVCIPNPKHIQTVSGRVHRSEASVAPATATGDKTEITVTFTDESGDDYKTSLPSSPVRSNGNSESLSQGSSRRHSKRQSLAVTRRDSIRPSGPGKRENGTTRRESLMPNGHKGRSRSVHASGTRLPQTRRRSMMPGMPSIEDTDAEC
ncbi:Potassium voltage-gated channel protein Shaw [Holothuria leucospilota]|uniref:Potassium voltage-gated channel protein Shaw n=1 Tax=Holothuria leucospilota TaxID=206669 RepID=A0A9Q0YLN3_HOLLE|nr:Potassium voltage-gated channel protein Shaw [Holothuria leucospilota]